MSDDDNPRLKPSLNRERDRKDRENGENGDTGAGGDGEIALEASPGEAYVIYIEMNNLSNKLKLLNYEDEYLIRWKMKPLSR